MGMKLGMRVQQLECLQIAARLGDQKAQNFELGLLRCDHTQLSRKKIVSTKSQNYYKELMEDADARSKISSWNSARRKTTIGSALMRIKESVANDTVNIVRAEIQHQTQVNLDF